MEQNCFGFKNPYQKFFGDGYDIRSPRQPRRSLAGPLRPRRVLAIGQIGAGPLASRRVVHGEALDQVFAPTLYAA